jgi:O-antigen/teichoic acid export membrane protein
MSFLRKAILVNTTEFFCLVIATFQSIVLSRVLGPAGVGQYATINSVMMVILQMVSLGFPLSFLYHSQRNPDSSSEYLVNTICAMILMGTVGGTVLTILVRLKTDYFGVVPWFLLIGLFTYVPIHLQGLVARSVLLIKIQAHRISLMRVLSMGGSFVPIVVFSLLGILSAHLAILCVVFAALMMAVAGWSGIWSTLDFSKRPSLRPCYKLGSMGIRIGWADMMIVLNSQISILIIKHLIDNFESVGYFSRGQRVALLVVTAGQAVAPLLFSKWASLAEDRIARHVEKVMRFASTVVVIMIVVVLLTGKWIILLLYGKEFLPAVRPMMILLPGAALYLLSKALIVLLSSRGRPEIAALFLTAAALINVVLSWYLIPIADIAGAAWASTASNIVLLCGLVFIVGKKFGIRTKHCLFVTRNDVNAAISTSFKRNA